MVGGNNFSQFVKGNKKWPPYIFTQGGDTTRFGPITHYAGSLLFHVMDYFAALFTLLNIAKVIR